MVILTGLVIVHQVFGLLIIMGPIFMRAVGGLHWVLELVTVIITTMITGGITTGDNEIIIITDLLDMATTQPEMN